MKAPGSAGGWLLYLFEGLGKNSHDDDGYSACLDSAGGGSRCSKRDKLILLRFHGHPINEGQALGGVQ
jgi:hypothetical protein